MAAPPAFFREPGEPPRGPPPTPVGSWMGPTVQPQLIIEDHVQLGGQRRGVLDPRPAIAGKRLRRVERGRAKATTTGIWRCTALERTRDW